MNLPHASEIPSAHNARRCVNAQGMQSFFLALLKFHETSRLMLVSLISLEASTIFSQMWNNNSFYEHDARKADPFLYSASASVPYIVM